MNTENKPLTVNNTSVFRNWISFIGMVVGVGALFSFLLLFTLDALAKFSNPYVSLLTYMGVPAFLITAEMLAAKRHTGAHSPVSGAKTIIANSNQFAYAA